MTFPPLLPDFASYKAREPGPAMWQRRQPKAVGQEKVTIPDVCVRRSAIVVSSLGFCALGFLRSGRLTLHLPLRVLR